MQISAISPSKTSTILCLLPFKPPKTNCLDNILDGSYSTKVVEDSGSFFISIKDAIGKLEPFKDGWTMMVDKETSKILCSGKLGREDGVLKKKIDMISIPDTGHFTELETSIGGIALSMDVFNLVMVSSSFFSMVKYPLIGEDANNLLYRLTITPTTLTFETQSYLTPSDRSTCEIAVAKIDKREVLKTPTSEVVYTIKAKYMEHLASVSTYYTHVGLVGMGGPNAPLHLIFFESPETIKTTHMHYLIAQMEEE